MNDDRSTTGGMDEPAVEVSTPLNPDAPPSGQAVVEETEALGQTEGVIRSGKLAGRTLWSAVWILALPIMLQQTMQACVGLFDKIIAGSLPGDMVVPAIDGLGVGAYVGWFTGIAMAGLGIGGQAIIARGIGGGDTTLSAQALGQSISLSVIWGALVGVTLWYAVTPLAAVCELTPAATMYAEQYVRVIAVVMPFTGIMMVGGMCLHGAGETAKPSIIALAVNVVNILASWTLSGVDVSVGGSVVENPFPFDLHVYGIAGGTAAAYVVGAMMTLHVLIRGVRDLRLEAPRLAPDRSMTWRIVRIGVPGFAEGISMWLVNLFVLRFIGEIALREAQRGGSGEGLQGAHIIAVQWEAFSFLPGFAIGTAAGALAGQYLGAGNPRMARKAILVCFAVAASIMGVLGFVYMFAGEFLTAIVSTAPVHLENVPPVLFICGLVQVFFAGVLVIRQGLRGAGDSTWAFIITSVSCYGVRLPAAYILGVTYDLGLPGVWIALCGELIVRSLLFGGRFLHGGWARIRV
ncbi:MAG: MATE family efflux transporter [Phycisphaeraceae bacterium]|nr:MAG: MATE family efflux transporter [Phycisphaeraceae bacterium]